MFFTRLPTQVVGLARLFYLPANTAIRAFNLIAHFDKLGRETPSFGKAKRVVLVARFEHHRHRAADFA